VDIVDQFERHIRKPELDAEFMWVPEHERAALVSQVAALQGEVATLKAAQAWQPIATAPQMRKVIVFYLNELGKKRTVMACYYKAKSLEMDDDYNEVGEYDDATGSSFAPEGWYEEHDGAEPLMPLSQPPTHWQPLPSPPPDLRACIDGYADALAALSASPTQPAVPDSTCRACHRPTLLGCLRCGYAVQTKLAALGTRP
jgi:hypothetical protein